MEIRRTESRQLQPLYLPGFIMHIRELDSRQRCFDDVILQPDAFVFQHVTLTPSIIRHHTPWELLWALDALCCQHHKNH